jgi:hypothetical protein
MRFGWPWGKAEPTPTSRAEFPDRLQNEIQQLAAIRDDALRVQPGSVLHSWLNGAIFALGWARDPYRSVPPSVPAAGMRGGIKQEVIP